MKLKPIRDYLLSMKGSAEDTPFGPEVLVFRVGGKMFGLMGWQRQPITLNLKCDPEYAIELRERHGAIAPGYHMNKQHWNTLTLDSSLPDELVFELVRDSYNLILASLPKKKRAEIEDA